MLEATHIQRCLPGAETSASEPTRKMTLTFEQRRKSRYRTRTDCGLELGWFLPRGNVLSDGDCLICTDGTVVGICSAAEEVTEVASEDALLISRAAYHLGNRHVPLDIASGRLRYQCDSVLDAMLVGLGLDVRHTLAPFNPEQGAYHGQGAHGHGHQHGQEHIHAHEHGNTAESAHSHNHD